MVDANKLGVADIGVVTAEHSNIASVCYDIRDVPDAMKTSSVVIARKTFLWAFRASYAC